MTALLSPAGAPPQLARWLAQQYDVFDEIGRGGASVVYLAHERATGRAVAVKVLDHAAGDAAALGRFAREVRIAAALRHPNVVQTLAAEECGGAAAFVTEYVAGGTLRAALRAALGSGEPWPYGRVAEVLRDVAAALAHAHAGRIVHRDVKPENIFLEHDTGRALLADFGIAVVLGAPGTAAAAGEAAGTPTYMAPEQIAGRPVDERTDVYALGLVGWEMLTGRRPWEGEPMHAVLHKQQHDRLPPLAALRPDIPAYLLAAVEGALAKDPRGRWRDGGEFLARLSPTPVRLPPVVAAGAGDASAATVRFDEPPAAGRRALGTRRRARGRAAVAGAAAVVALGAASVALPAGRGWTRPAGAPVGRAPVGRTPVSHTLAAMSAAPRRAAPAPVSKPGVPMTARPAPVRADPKSAAPSPRAAAQVASSPAPRPLPPETLSLAASAADRRLMRTVDAQVAAAYAALAETMRRSGGPGHEPRAVQELFAEQRRWEEERMSACGVARDPACLADRAARKVWELERRRARFVIDAAAPAPPGPAAKAPKPR